MSDELERNWTIEVRVIDPDTGEHEWQTVRPKGGSLYIFGSRDDAEYALSALYPDQTADEVRIFPAF